MGRSGALRVYPGDGLSGRRRYVYFAERDGRIKIGTSNQVDARMRELGTALLCQLPGGFDIEKALHERFALYALGHEWFRDSPEIRAFIGLAEATPVVAAPPTDHAAGEPVLMTVAEVALILRMSKSAVNRAIAAGTFPIPAFRPSPRKVLFSSVMLARYLATGEPVRVAS